MYTPTRALPPPEVQSKRTLAALTAQAPDNKRHATFYGRLNVPAGSTNVMAALTTVTGPHRATQIAIFADSVEDISLAADILTSSSPGLTATDASTDRRLSGQINPKPGLYISRADTSYTVDFLTM